MVQPVVKHAVVPLVGVHVACGGIHGGGQGAHLRSAPMPQVHPSAGVAGTGIAVAHRFSGSFVTRGMHAGRRCAPNAIMEH